MSLLHRLNVRLRARRLNRHIRWMQRIKCMYLPKPSPIEDYRDYLGQFKRTAK